MNCPVDQEVLQISERQGIEIDYCPQCRGVWLDRGELDKILDRVDGDDDDRRDDRSRDRGDRDRGDRDRDDRDRYRGDRDRDDRDRYRGDRDDRHPRKKKKSSFLSEIFEMGG